MKVSIITTSYNSSKTIEQTIASVQSQTYENVEHIIVDGKSTDDTLKIIQKYPHLISVSEEDQGLYDAMNKGISMASGDIIAILNSDDLYASTDVIERIVHSFEGNESDCILTDIEIFNDQSKKVIRTYSAKKWRMWMFRIGWQPPHPGFFAKSSVYKTHGTFDIQFKISADFDFMFRVLYHKKTPYTKIQKTTVRMRAGGISQNGFNSRAMANKEDHLSIKKYGYFSSPLLIWSKYLIKVLQYV